MIVDKILYERLLEKCSYAENGCLEWNGQRDEYGYGKIKIGYGRKDKRRARTHRVAMFCLGKIDSLKRKNGDKTVIRHLCHNRCCCNPDHLAIGSQRDNYYDSYFNQVRGHELAAEKRKIAVYYKGKEYKSMAELAKELGVARNSLYYHFNKNTREVIK